MATAPTTTNLPPTNPLTSSVILQSERDELFTKTENNFNTLCSQWENEYDQLEQFKANINTRGSDLQHEKVKNPGRILLGIERDGYLTQYWGFKATSEKIEDYIGELSKKITMYLPKERTYSDDKVKSEQKISKEEEANKIYLSKLQKFSEQATTLKNKYIETLNSQGWSLQRYCQIVDNEGRPIHWATRASNNVLNMISNPVIPKPNSSLTTSASSSSATPSQPQPSSSAATIPPSSSAIPTQPQTHTVAQAPSQTDTQAGKTTPQQQPEKPEPSEQPQSPAGKGDVEQAKGSNASSPSTPTATENEKTADSNKPKNSQKGDNSSKRDSTNKGNKS